jgi:hypothetical protein
VARPIQMPPTIKLKANFSKKISSIGHNLSNSSNTIGGLNIP